MGLHKEKQFLPKILDAEKTSNTSALTLMESDLVYTAMKGVPAACQYAINVFNGKIVIITIPLIAIADAKCSF